MDDIVIASLNQVHSSNVKDQEHALRVLINRTLIENVRKEVVTKMGGGFIELLQSESEVVLMLSAWLLSHIAIDDPNCSTLLKTGVLKYLMPLLASENTDVLEKTLWVVNNLLTSGVREYLTGKLSIISSLASLLIAPSAHIIYTSSEILINLMRKDSCIDFEENQKMFYEKKGLEVLTEQLAPKFPPIPHKTQLSLISLLHVFTLYDTRYRIKIAETGVISCLVQLIANPSTAPDVREHSLRILYNLSLEESVQKYFLLSSVLPALVSFVQTQSTEEINKNPNIMALSVLIMANEIVMEEMRTSLRQVTEFGAAVCKLGSALTDGTKPTKDLELNLNLADTKQAFAEIVANASCDEILRYNLQNTTETKKIVEKLAIANDASVQEVASSALENLSIPVEQPAIQLFREDSVVKSALDIKTSAAGNKLYQDLDPSSMPYVRISVAQQIVSELFTTEQSYVYNLGVLVRVRKIAKPGLLITPDINKIFLNCKVIYNLHKDLLRSFGVRFKDNAFAPCVASALSEFWDNTKAVEEYCNFVTNFDNAQSFSHQLCSKNTALRKLLEELAMHKEAKGLSLFSYMIQPVQRIPRYILLLEDLRKRLPSDDPDGANLKIALEKTKKVAESLNEARREAEKAAKVKEIQDKLVDVPKMQKQIQFPQGFVLMGLKECLLDGMLVEEGLFRSRHILCVDYQDMFLFPDVLMCTFPKKKTLKIETIIQLKDVTKVSATQEKGSQQSMLHLRYKEKESEKELVMYTSHAEATEWATTIRIAQSRLPKKK